MLCSEVPNKLINFKFTSPLYEWFLKSSTGGVWNSNGVAQTDLSLLLAVHILDTKLLCLHQSVRQVSTQIKNITSSTTLLNFIELTIYKYTILPID